MAGAGLWPAGAAAFPTTGTITSNSAVVLCPAHTAVSGLDVEVEGRGYVDRVAPLCRHSSGTVTRGPAIGPPSDGSQGFRPSSCGPAPMVAVGIYGRSGDVIDALGARCGHPGRPITNAPLRGGKGGGRRGPFDCRIGQRLIGLQGKVDRDYFGAPDISGVTGVCSGRARGGGGGTGGVGGTGGNGGTPAPNGTATAVSGYQTSDGYEHVLYLTSSDQLDQWVWYPSQTVQRRFIADATGAVDVGGYQTIEQLQGSSTIVQHAILARSSGEIDEVWWVPGGPVNEDMLAQIPGVTHVSGYTTSDGYQHVLVLTSGGDIDELFWLPNQGVHQDMLATVPDAVDVGGYQTVEQFQGSTQIIQHAIVARASGEIDELWWPPGQPVNQDQIANAAGVSHVSGYSTSDGYEHVLFTTGSGDVDELFWLPSQGVHQDTLTNVSGPVDISGYSTTDGTQHAIVARSSGETDEFWWPPGQPVQEQVLPQLR